MLALIKHNPGRRQSEMAEALNIECSNFVPIIEAPVIRATAPVLAESDRAAAVLSDAEPETLTKLIRKLYSDKKPVLKRPYQESYCRCCVI